MVTPLVKKFSTFFGTQSSLLYSQSPPLQNVILQKVSTKSNSDIMRGVSYSSSAVIPEIMHEVYRTFIIIKINIISHYRICSFSDSFLFCTRWYRFNHLFPLKQQRTLLLSSFNSYSYL